MYSVCFLITKFDVTKKPQLCGQNFFHFFLFYSLSLAGAITTFKVSEQRIIHSNKWGYSAVIPVT